MIRIAQDELKSSANDQLVVTAQQLVKEINDLYERTWLAPLVLIRNALDDPQLGVEEKISLLTLGIADIPDIVALQVTVEGQPCRWSWSRTIRRTAQGRRPRSLGGAARTGGLVGPSATAVAPRYQTCATSQTDDWLATVVLPMQALLGEGESTFSARINLDALRQMIQTPVHRTGSSRSSTPRA